MRRLAMADSPPVAAPEELDPELVSLKRTRGRVGPVLALSVMVLCAYVFWVTRADLVYATRGDSPTDLGDAAGMFASGKAVDDNSHARVRVVPDGRQVGWLLGNQAQANRLVPALGTSKRLWLVLSDDVYAKDLPHDLWFSGRLRRLDEMAYADELAEYVRGLAPELRAISPRSLTGGPPTVDIAGDSLALGEGDAVTLDERVPGAALVTLYANDHVKDEAGARAALAAASLPPVALAQSTTKSWTYEIAAPGGLEPVRTTIAQADLYAAMSADAVTDKLIRHEGHWRDVKVDPAAGAVHLASGTTVPFDRIVRLTARVPARLHEDPWVLVDGERPGPYWYMFLLDGALALVFLAMTWALVRSLRDPRPPTAPLVLRPPTVPSDTPEP
jgi:hypothetical protein